MKHNYSHYYKIVLNIITLDYSLRNSSNKYIYIFFAILINYKQRIRLSLYHVNSFNLKDNTFQEEKKEEKNSIEVF